MTSSPHPTDHDFPHAQNRCTSHLSSDQHSVYYGTTTTTSSNNLSCVQERWFFWILEPVTCSSTSSSGTHTAAAPASAKRLASRRHDQAEAGGSCGRGPVRSVRSVRSVLLWVVLEVAEGEQRPHSASGQFFGRVLWDRGVLGLGQVRILLTRVSAEDHGQFWCYIYANYHHPTSRWSHIRSEFFNLTVTRTKPTETRSGEFFNLTVTRTKPTETRSGGATRVSELAPLRTAFLCFMFSCMVLMAVAIVSASLCGRCT